MDKEYVSLDKIRTHYHINQLRNMTGYLIQIFKDLSNHSQAKISKRNVDKFTFVNFTNLPYYVGEKLFHVFDKDKKGYLLQEEFINGFEILVNGSLEDLESFIFQMLDIDMDGKIAKQDLEVISVFIAYNNNKTVDYINNLREIIRGSMDGKSELYFSQFKNLIESSNSDVFILILAFIYERIP